MPPSQLKILYIANSEKIGGAERSLLSIFNYIHLWDVTPYYASIYDGELTAEIRKLGVPFIKLPPFSRYKLPQFLFECFRLAQKIKKLQIDAIHANRLHDAFYGFLPARLAGISIIAHHRDSSYTSIDNFLWKRVDCNVCIADWLNQTFVDGKGEVIHNGLELDLFNSETNGADFRANISINENQILVGTIGRITQIKGQHLLLDAAEIIIRKRKDCYFLIQGDTFTLQDEDYKMSLLNRINQSRDLKDRVILREGTREVASVLAALDISVVPSLREPFGRVIIESMAMKKPVISTNYGGPTEIITPDTGLLVPTNDPAALADAIVTLADSPALRTRMGEAGRARVEKFFRVENTVKKIADLYYRFTGWKN